jgi:hypothetical protein
MSRYELSIEVLDAEFSAESWRSAYGDMLTATAIEHGAEEWQWIERSWGLVLEIAFSKQRDAERWRELPGIRSAFDAVPDPVNGLVFHRGWGGTSGSGEPRRRGPRAGAGGAEVPLPDDPERVDVVAHWSRESVGDVTIRTAATS